MATQEAIEKINDIILQEQESIKSITVDRLVPLEYDVGNLLVEDSNTLDKKQLGDPEQRDDYLYSLARDGVQGLFSKIWELPSNVDQGMIYVTLPGGTTRLPRDKPVPKEKQLTKWEAYRKEKGFNQRKKTKATWDDTLKKWIPRYGYRKVVAEKEKNWVKEVPGNADPYEDQFAKAANVKKENIAKNEYKRLKNIARGKKITVPGVGITGNKFSSTKDVGKAMHLAHQSTASIGKFQKRIRDERMQKVNSDGKKRDYDYIIAGEEEKNRSLSIAKKIKSDEFNLEGALHKQIRAENYQMNNVKKQKFVRRSKAGKKRRGKPEPKTNNREKVKGSMRRTGGSKGKTKRTAGDKSRSGSGRSKGKGGRK